MTYSETMRLLFKKKDKEKMLSFMTTFHKAFQEALEQELEDPAEVALLQAQQLEGLV